VAEPGKLTIGATDDDRPPESAKVSNLSHDTGSPRRNRCTRPPLSLSIPTSSIASFGTTPGSLIQWGLSQYRVTSSTVTKMTVTLTCVKHVTVGDFDAIWSGLTVGDHDAVWATYQTKDQIVYPYKTA